MEDRKDSDNTVFNKNVPPNPGEEDIDDDDELELDIEDIDLEDWGDER